MRSTHSDGENDGLTENDAVRASAPTTLVGRRSELGQLRRVLATARLVTLVGPAGVGKTRLALESARRAAMPDEIAAVAELAPISDPGDVSGAIAGSFGVVAAGTTATAAIAAWLGQRAALLVVDNCEHVRDECARVIATLLASCPRLRVIATSREALRSPDERRWSVPPLSIPAEGAPAGWRRSDAVRLFEERARTAMPAFAVDGRNADTVLGICRSLEGLPLAIELAASRLWSLSLADVRRGLDEQLQLLAPPIGGHAGRHDTMRGAIDWSHALLEDPERRVFRRLAVFEGGFVARAAETVCADGDLPPERVMAVVAALVERSLVRLSGGDRYTLLEVLRQYGLERLDEAVERDASERRRAEYVARIFDDADPGPSTRPMETLRPIIADHANVRAAMRWSQVHDPALARPVLAKLWMVYVFPQPGTDPAEVERWLERGLEDAGLSDSVRGRILVGLAQRRFARGDREGSAAAAADALRLADACDDGQLAATSHHRLALSAQAAGQTAEALEHFTAAIERYATVNPAGQAWALAHRGHVRGQAGDGLGARTDFDAALAICDGLPHHWRVRAIVRTLEGEHLLDTDPNAARDAFAEALRIFLRIGSEVPIARAFRGLAEIAAPSDPERALRLAGAADELRARVGDTWPKRPGEDRLAGATRRAGAHASALLAEGRRMTTEEAVSYALGGSAVEAGQIVLSAREREVAALVAEGLTSKEIAYRLRVTERTAENHVEHILVKLGLRSRAQIARWATEQQPHPQGH